MKNNIPFKTNTEQLNNLSNIKQYMLNHNYDNNFIIESIEIAKIDQGVYDLLNMLYLNADEIQEIIKDINSSIADYKITKRNK